MTECGEWRGKAAKDKYTCVQYIPRESMHEKGLVGAFVHSSAA